MNVSVQYYVSFLVFECWYTSLSPFWALATRQEKAREKKLTVKVIHFIVLPCCHANTYIVDVHHGSTVFCHWCPSPNTLPCLHSITIPLVIPILSPFYIVSPDTKLKCKLHKASKKIGNGNQLKFYVTIPFLGCDSIQHNLNRIHVLIGFNGTSCPISLLIRINIL